MAKTVLVVEDNALNAKLFRDLLIREGFDVVCTDDGRETSELIVKHTPCLILMDVQLRGLSGLDIVKALKADAATKDIPVVMITAYAMEGDREKILASGCDDYISKPISIKPFLELVRTLVGG